jgi:anthranilate phosphoribosyltransferase
VDISCPEPLVDIVSTGGDRLATFNISTTAAFVAAGAGVRIAKHGSRGQTSHAGAADLLQALGARIDLPPEAVAACVRDVGVGFMFAPLHYRPIRHMVPMRRTLNMRTVFNFIAPILNPAGVKRQLTGVSDARYLSTLAEALRRMGSEHALFAHGEDGLDEISVGGPTTLVELKDGAVSPPFMIEPEDFGLQRWPMKDLAGGDPLRNAEITKRVLSGESGAAQDIVLLNAGAAVYLAGKAASIGEGVETARAALESGRAWETMVRFVDYTKHAGARALQPGTRA